MANRIKKLNTIDAKDHNTASAWKMSFADLLSVLAVVLIFIFSISNFQHQSVGQLATNLNTVFTIQDKADTKQIASKAKLIISEASARELDSSPHEETADAVISEPKR